MHVAAATLSKRFLEISQLWNLIPVRYRNVHFAFPEGCRREFKLTRPNNIVPTLIFVEFKCSVMIRITKRKAFHVLKYYKIPMAYSFFNRRTFASSRPNTLYHEIKREYNTEGAGCAVSRECRRVLELGRLRWIASDCVVCFYMKVYARLSGYKKRVEKSRGIESEEKKIVKALERIRCALYPFAESYREQRRKRTQTNIERSQAPWKNCKNCREDFLRA